MKVLLDIKDSRVPFFMELLKSLDYIQIIKKVNDKNKDEHMQDIVDAFQDAALYEHGKKSLKTANDLLNEL